MRPLSRLAVIVALQVAVAVSAGACRSPEPGLPCGDQRCTDGEICRVVQTATSVQSMCVRDDGNDGCGRNCGMMACRDGVVTAGEMCDDGNAVDFDACKNDCTVGLHTYLKASNTSPGDSFGHVVALSADGSTLAVSAPDESSAATGVGGDQANDSAPLAGAVYVFTRSGATWIQQAYVKASNSPEGGLLGLSFGHSLALSADGSTLAVGAPQEGSMATGVGGDQTDRSAALAGAAYVFTRSGTTWAQQAYIKASNTNGDDAFGQSLALSADGSTLAVGAPWEDSAAIGMGGDQDDNSAEDAGAVYVFTRSGTTWTQQAYLKASNTSAFDEFGSRLALSADGSTLAVGTPWEDSAANGINGDQADNSAFLAGAVYVFISSDSTWTQQAYLKASNTSANLLGLDFGSSLALSADGSTLVVGAPGESSAATGVGGDQADSSADRAGAAYVFTRSDAAWTQQAYLKASNTDPGDAFGASVALSADGSTLAVGARDEASAAIDVGGDQDDDSAPSAGAAYVFARSGATWTLQAYLKASNTNAGDEFGWSLALSADGTTLAVGAPGEASRAAGVGGDQAGNSAPFAGAAYVRY